jgi:hypothetical protein
MCEERPPIEKDTNDGLAGGEQDHGTPPTPIPEGKTDDSPPSEPESAQ